MHSSATSCDFIQCRIAVSYIRIAYTPWVRKKTSCGARHNKPRPPSIEASRGLPELTQNVIRSSHGHSTPSLKISCKSVQPFSRNLADKKQRNKDTNKEIARLQYPVPGHTGGGVTRHQTLVHFTEYLQCSLTHLPLVKFCRPSSLLLLVGEGLRDVDSCIAWHPQRGGWHAVDRVVDDHP